MPPPETLTPPALLTKLEEQIRLGHRHLLQPELAPGLVEMWVGQVRQVLRSLFGVDSAAVNAWPPCPGTSVKGRTHEEVRARLAKAERLLAQISTAGATLGRMHADRVFIGHGRS